MQPLYLCTSYTTLDNTRFDDINREGLRAENEITQPNERGKRERRGTLAQIINAQMSPINLTRPEYEICMTI